MRGIIYLVVLIGAISILAGFYISDIITYVNLEDKKNNVPKLVISFPDDFGIEISEYEETRLVPSLEFPKIINYTCFNNTLNLTLIFDVNQKRAGLEILFEPRVYECKQYSGGG